MNFKNYVACLLRCSGVRFLFTAVASCLLLQTASATQLFSDGFNYTAGTALHGNGGWTLGGTALSITNANLTYPNLADLGGNALLITSGPSSTVANFNPTSISAGTVYFSFVFSPTALPTANNELAALLASGSTGPGGSGDPLGVYVGAGSAGTYKIGVRHGGSGATYGANTTGLTLNSTNFFVVAYTFNPSTTDDSVSLWINPTPGGSMPAADATVVANSGTVDAANLQVVGFKAQSLASGAGIWAVDTLRIGDTWADVTPTVVPEPSTVMLVGAGFVVMLGAIRRRRS